MPIGTAFAGYASRHQHRAGACFRGGFESARHEVADDGGLELGNHGERSRPAQREKIGGFAAALLQRFLAGFDFFDKFGMGADVVQDGGLDSAETEIVGIALDFHGAKIWGVFFAEFFSGCGGVCGELVDNRAAGIAEREEPGDFVVGFARGIVARAA